MTDALVLGAGVIGLTTAAVLKARGLRVTIWTRDDPLATTSAVAAAIWYPYLAEPRDRVLPWAMATLDRLRELARDPATGVTMVRAIELHRAVAAPPSWAAGDVAMQPAAAEELPPSRPFGFVTEVPLCDTTRYLPWLRAQVVDGGGVIERRAVGSLQEALDVVPRVVNCTGLGARQLCGDDTLRPARGQVVCVLPFGLDHAVIDDTDPERPVYLLPRGDDVVLGGTLQFDDQRTAEDPADTASIRERCGELYPAAATAPLVRVKVGLRPCRPTVRLEREFVGEDRLLVHNYGHGGSGFTLAWGCAVEAAELAGAAGLPG